MSTSATANRIYERKAYVSGDFQGLAPDVVLLRAIYEPGQTQGGIHRPGQYVQRHARTCPAFEVAMLPSEMTKGNPLNLAVGDIVACRNVLVDPLLGDELAICDMYLGIFAVLERA